MSTRTEKAVISRHLLIDQSDSHMVCPALPGWTRRGQHDCGNKASFYSPGSSSQVILAPGNNIHHGCHQVTGLSNIMNTAVCQGLVQRQHNIHSTSHYRCWLGLLLPKPTISRSHQLQQCCLGKIGNKKTQRICLLEQLNYNGDPNSDRQRTAVEFLQSSNALHAVLRATLLESGAAWMSGVAEGHFQHWSFSDRK